jgi:hypothetical protein
MMDVRSCRGADRDVHHYLAQIKYGQIIMKYKNTHATGLNTEKVHFFGLYRTETSETMWQNIKVVTMVASVVAGYGERK